MIRAHHIALGALGAAMLYAVRKAPVKQVVANMPHSIPVIPKVAHEALMRKIKTMVARKDTTTLHTSVQMIEHVKVAEGLMLDKYNDAGSWAIGYGHRFRCHLDHLHNKVYDEPLKDHISLEQAVMFLNEDILTAESGVSNYCHAPLTQNEFDACVDFCFNMGEGTFAHSDLCKFLNAGNYNAAANEFPKWCHSRGVVLKGLLKRRLIEQHVFKEGNYSYAPTESDMKPFEGK